MAQDRLRRRYPGDRPAPRQPRRWLTWASGAGAAIAHLRHHATYSNVQTTGRYNGGTIEKTRKVAQLRVAHRGGKNV